MVETCGDQIHAKNTGTCNSALFIKCLVASIPVFLETKLSKFIEAYFACIFSSIVCDLPIAWLIHAPLLERKFLNRNEIY